MRYDITEECRIADYRLIRSGRRTMCIQIGEDGITVRAPLRASDSEIAGFISEKQAWIQKSLARLEARRRNTEDTLPLSYEELKALRDEAYRYIPERVKLYAGKIGVKYNKITVRNQKTRWGSCSAGGNLSFNCLLMLTPPDIRDSVIVHELCHLKEMNHSAKFYGEVLKAFPNYRECDRWLKENGASLMKRCR